MSTTEIEQLAVMFRVNDPNLGHVSTLEAMNELGLAYAYGVFRGTPKRYKRERKMVANGIADHLQRIADRRKAITAKQ